MALNDLDNDDFIFIDENKSGKIDVPSNFILNELSYEDSKIPIHYTLDNNDFKFLKFLNMEASNKIHCDFFKMIFENLILEEKILQEKIIEKFELRNNKKNDCNICFTEKEYEVIFCRSCLLPVHRLCYGLPANIDENDFLCSPCENGKQFSINCKFCNKKGGAMKRLFNRKYYAHILCTHFLQSADFSNIAFLEPIEENYEEKSICTACRRAYGSTMKCGNEECNVFFHTCCAFERGFETDFQNYKILCEIHGMLQKPTVYFFKPQKTVFFYLKKHGIPMNSYVLNKIIENQFYHVYTSDYLPFFYNVYSYYISKRKYDMALLQNRFYAKHSNIPEIIFSKKDRVHKNYTHIYLPHRNITEKYLHNKPPIKKYILLNDHLKNKYNVNLQLVDLYNKIREKMERTKYFKGISRNFYNLIFIYQNSEIKGRLLILLSKLNTNDFSEFRRPVSKEIAPDYNIYIKHPKSFLDIQMSIFSILNYSYECFGNDINLIANNCLIYNSENEYYIKKANELLLKFKEMSYDDIVIDKKTIEYYLKIFLFNFAP